MSLRPAGDDRRRRAAAVSRALENAAAEARILSALHKSHVAAPTAMPGPLPLQPHPAYLAPRDHPEYSNYTLNPDAYHGARDYDTGALLRQYAKKTIDGYGIGMWEGDRYVGDWSNGVPNGNGKLLGDDFYDGEWRDGKRHGNGTSFWNPTEVRFIGEWRDGMPYKGTVYKFWNGEPLGQVVEGVYKEL